MNHLPKYIDPFDLAKQGRTLLGQFALGDMSRLCERLCQRKGVASFELQFSQTIDNKPCVIGDIKAVLVFSCERCQEPVSLEVESTVRWRPLVSDDEAQHLPPDFEPLVTHSKPVLLLEMIEEELLLASPMIPKHPEQDCPVHLPTHLR